MRNTARACIFGAALTLMAGAALPANAAAPDISPCTNGGYVHYVDPATGQPYSNQGRCVSTVARNGQLVPVLPPLTFGGWAYNDLTDPNSLPLPLLTAPSAKKGPSTCLLASTQLPAPQSSLR
jgi:hypothetical protein